MRAPIMGADWGMACDIWTRRDSATRGSLEVLVVVVVLLLEPRRDAVADADRAALLLVER